MNPKSPAARTSRKALSPRSYGTPLLLVLFGLTGPLLASGAPSEEQFKTQVFETRHIDARQLYSTLDLLRLEYRGQPELNTIVATGPGERLRTFKEILSALDQPPEPTANLLVTVSIVEASASPLEGSSSQPPPQALSAVTGQLRELFGYQHFGVLDTTMLTMTDRSRAAAEGGYLQGRFQVYGLALRATVMDPSEDTGRRSIRLENLEFHSRLPDVPREAGLREVAINTNVEVLDGQTAVVGKASPASTDAAVVLVLRVEIED